MVNMVIAAMIYNGAIATYYSRTPSLWGHVIVIDADGRTHVGPVQW